MFGLSLDDIRHQARFMVHVVSRDFAKRTASAIMMMGICLWAGERLAAVTMAILVVATEIEAKLLARRLPARDRDISLGFLIALWVTNWFSTVVYLIPAIALAQQPSVPLLLAGYVWLFGVFVYVSNTFVFLPFFNWTLMIPAFGAAFIMFSVASTTAFAQGQELDWTVTAALMCVYVFNTIETIGLQKDTHRALRAAREEADSRLRQLEHLTRHDALTGVLNRRAFDEDLSHLLGAAGHRSRIAVLMIDLDGFKPINDSFGHAAGDTVLRAVARRLGELVGERGLVGRVGGDEFAIAVPGMVGSRDAVAYAADVARRIEKPIPHGGRELVVTASIGVAMGYGQSAETLGAQADQAMLQAKATLQGGVVMFDPRDNERRPNMDIKSHLAEAIRGGGLTTRYWPRVDIATGRLAGVEVAPHWDSAPADCRVPIHDLAMLFGLQGDYLAWLARSTMADITALLEAGIDPGNVSLRVPQMALATVSGRDEIERLIRLYPAARAHLTLTLPEAALAARAGEAARLGAARMRQAGLRLALGNFGTGAASFQQLQKLEIDEMGLDVSLTLAVAEDARTRVMVGGVLAMAEGLRLVTVAEGVTHEAQLTMLGHLGCGYAQGPLFGAAIEAADLARAIGSGQARIRA